MGYYEGRRENPCPRCGGVVLTLFISVSPMSFSERCATCGASDFTKAEREQLGMNKPVTVDEWIISTDSDIEAVAP